MAWWLGCNSIAQIAGAGIAWGAGEANQAGSVLEIDFCGMYKFSTYRSVSWSESNEL